MPDHHRHLLAVAALLHRAGGEVHASTVPGPAGFQEVGRWGPLPCWSTTFDAASALRIARRLARQGELGLLIAAEPRGTRQLICVTLAPVRAVTLTTAMPESLALVRLARAVPSASMLGSAMTCAAALDVDAAGRRAFRALQGGIDGAVRQLPGNISIGTRHAWVLLQVTRLLFLRFVEEEGWLAGRSNFLAEEFDHCLQQRRHPESHLLAPLFFGTLNRPTSQRSRRAQAFGAVPFLNGGLFEAHPIERGRRWNLPVTAWHDLMSLIVDSFEVTLDHGDVGDRVSPELLGRVFEGMMEPAARKEAGTFYTPVELVPAVLRATLSSHLAQRIARSEEQIEQHLDDRDPALDAALLSLRILDPAVGSGAFLVGALAILCDSKHASASRIRHVITRRLFGVDRSPIAVRLTELRLWLELLRAMRNRPVARVTPLPNLDTSIRAGDSLHDPFAGLRLPAGVSRRLAVARQRATTSHGAERRMAVARLRHVEQVAARAALRSRATVLRETIADLVDQAHGVDLFGTRGTLRSEVQHRVTALRSELRWVQHERKRLRDDGAAPAFGIESAFAPVLTRGGFDLVVGNPPWVRGERLSPRERAALAARYRWWRGAGSGWRHTPDLAIAFVERSHELLAPGGTLGLLVPGKLATTRYATRCRAALAEHATVHMVADLGRDPRASFDATIYPMALVASRQRATTDHLISLDLAREHHTRQSDWCGASTWSLSAPDLQKLARRLASVPTLGTACRPSLGVKTGANPVFLDPPMALQEWTRPALRGRDVRPLAADATARLLWLADSRGTPWASLPLAVQRYLAPHRSLLEQRSDLTSGPWWQLFRVATATDRWRVAWSDLAPALRAAPLTHSDVVPINSCYVVALADEVMMLACAAWLNGAVISTLARSVAEPAANDYARYGARAVGSVPLPAGALRDESLAELGRAEWSPEVGAAIDQRVAQWLRLTDHECEMVNALRTTGR